jgi:hypothetical protein
MIETKPLPPIELLRELFDYDIDTGKLYWKVRPNGRIPAGSECVRCNKLGYSTVLVKRKEYQQSRIIYALCYNEDPHPYEIDHINKDRGDNRITNLRKVTRHENMLTATRHPGKTGELYIRPRGLKFRVIIPKVIDKTCDTLEEAIKVRDDALNGILPPKRDLPKYIYHSHKGKFVVMKNNKNYGTRNTLEEAIELLNVMLQIATTP